ncbi:Nitrogen permease regulator 2 [Tulasnella sp. UAMH 9824]|nr:Nitrogen permease regulator 2 [Tulasnella sp. UAMH 9824]
MSSPTLDINALAEGGHASQVNEMDEIESRMGMDLAESKSAKLSARDLLATLWRLRLFTREIHFNGNSLHARGGSANVDVAMLVEIGKKKKTRKTKKVAVKKFIYIVDAEMTEEKFLRVFVNELRILDKLSHPNIVEILGFVEHIAKGIAWLIFPWEDNGNLRDFLRSGQRKMAERLSLLNILVNDSHRALITDFGTARVLRELQGFSTAVLVKPGVLAKPASPEDRDRPLIKVTASTTALTLTGPGYSLRWAPPEVLNGLPPNLASDIWALGWIAWEAVTDNYPFEELKSEFDVTMKIMEGQLPCTYSHEQLSQVYQLCSLMETCWKPGPMERPSAAECETKLRWLEEYLAKPLRARSNANYELDRSLAINLTAPDI